MAEDQYVQSFAWETSCAMSSLINPTSQLQEIVNFHFGNADHPRPHEAFEDFYHKCIEPLAKNFGITKSDKPHSEPPDQELGSVRGDPVIEDTVKREELNENEPAPTARSYPDRARRTIDRMMPNVDGRVVKGCDIKKLLQQIVNVAEEHDISLESLDHCTTLYSIIFYYDDHTLLDLAQTISNCKITCTAPAIHELESIGLAILKPMANNIARFFAGGLSTVNNLVSFVHFTRIIAKHNEMLEGNLEYRRHFGSPDAKTFGLSRSESFTELPLHEKIDAFMQSIYVSMSQSISAIEWDNQLLLGKKICMMVDTFGDGILISLACSKFAIEELDIIDIEALGQINDGMIDLFPDLAHIYAPWNGLLLGRPHASSKYSANRARLMRKGHRPARLLLNLLNPDRIGISDEVEDTGDDIEMEG